MKENYVILDRLLIFNNEGTRTGSPGVPRALPEFNEATYKPLYKNSLVLVYYRYGGNYLMNIFKKSKLFFYFV